MKELFTLTFIMASNLLLSQEFSFQMYFEDKQGNRDTITLGYDDNASDSIGTEFNELNIIDQARSQDLEVRISNASNFEDRIPSKESKISISSNRCNDFWFPRWTISISSSNWPISASWDSTVFDKECIIGTVITGFPPGAWFDAGGCCSGLEYEYLKDTSKIIFNPSFAADNDASEGFINAAGDTISQLYFAFGDAKQLGVSTSDISFQDDISVWPNPAKNFLQIKNHIDGEAWIIYDLAGRRMAKGHQSKIDVSNLRPGLYLIKISQMSRKFYKD